MGEDTGRLGAMTEGGDWLFVSRDEVLELHRHAIVKWGGHPDPIPTGGCVEGSIGSAKTASMYVTEDGLPDLLSAAAHLLRSLAKNHCFRDGNKRVAWMSLVRCLLLNDIAIKADEQEAIDLVDGVVNDRTDVQQILNWLAGHIVGTQDLT
jgi:death-on-curing protein